ncbi:aldehyde dehydrogenase [Chryseolinea sp. T2]|uniref:aldehyde dehydrogenase n=1 Tax=Chryseolinea sp. T2 TaxID=3129255 RepID=UPI0030784574
MERILNYIHGDLVPAASGAFMDNYDPATGRVYSVVPDSESPDINRAVEAAHAASARWQSMGIAGRSKILNKLADMLEGDAESFALAESMDSGKTLTLARTLDIPRAIANIRFFASAIMHESSDAHITDHTAINYTERVPVGVAGCISPWNLPLYLFTWKVAPALAAGCTVVAKPSELTPMTAYLFSKLCAEAELPPGVLNVVHGAGSKAGHEIVAHPGVKAVSFTGGTATGKKIAAVAAPTFKKLSLELGGKNPSIIFADCDFEQALNVSVQASFTNQGEICLCGSRILVEASIYERFVKTFVERASKLTVGDPLHHDINVGALISSAHRDKVMSYISLAREEGGSVLCGGEIVHVSGRCSGGYFVAPTVITGLTQQCHTNQDEIFGPVVTIAPFETESEAIAMANSTRYGLAASIWTENLRKAHRVSSAVQCGIIWVNCWLFRDLRTPFGGMKDSGVGREGGWNALNFFTEAKNVCIKL